MKDLLVGYFKGLFDTWYKKAIGFLEFIGFVLLIFFPDIGIPRWTIYLALVLSFLLANFLLYKELNEKSLEETDIAKQNIEELTQAIKLFQDNIPKLELLFKTKDGYSQKQTIVVPLLPDKREIEQLIQQESEILKEIPKSKGEEVRTKDSSGIEGLLKATREMAALTYASLGRKRKSDEQYKDEYEKYFRTYGNCLRKLERYEYTEARYRQLNFAVSNTGYVVGENLVVLIHFPDNFKFPTNIETFDLQLSFEKPKPPKRPELYEDLFAQFREMRSMHNIGNLSRSHGVPSIDTSIVKGPFINHTNSTEVRYEIDRVMHNFTEDDFKEIGFFCKEGAIGYTHELKFEIHADALPNPIMGNLLLEIQLQEQGDE